MDEWDAILAGESDDDDDDVQELTEKLVEVIAKRASMQQKIAKLETLVKAFSEFTQPTAQPTAQPIREHPEAFRATMAQMSAGGAAEQMPE